MEWVVMSERLLNRVEAVLQDYEGRLSVQKLNPNFWSSRRMIRDKLTNC